MTSTGLAAGPMLSKTVSFRIVNDLNETIARQLAGAINEFMKDSDLGRGVDEIGYFEATKNAMIEACLGNGDLWIGTLDEALVIYILAGMSNEVDNRLTYWVSQAWVRKDQRGLPWVRQAWQTIRERAIETKCAHIVTISGRENNEAYCRFLGKGWHIYGVLLKEDLGEASNG